MQISLRDYPFIIQAEDLSRIVSQNGFPITNRIIKVKAVFVKIFFAGTVLFMYNILKTLIENCSNSLPLNVYQNIISLAVPFFFIASGFLLSIKLKHEC